MIKATIQNIPYCTEIVFPCTETELSKKLGELGMNLEHLAPIATVIEIEPSELSVLTDCDVSLDALNYLGKRLDGMDKLESKQFLAVLSCDEAEIGYGLKNIINLTYNLARFTLVENTNDVECVGRIHMLNVRGGLSESEYQDKDWKARNFWNPAQGSTRNTEWECRGRRCSLSDKVGRFLPVRLYLYSYI